VWWTYCWWGCRLQCHGSVVPYSVLCLHWMSLLTTGTVSNGMLCHGSVVPYSVLCLRWMSLLTTGTDLMACSAMGRLYHWVFSALTALNVAAYYRYLLVCCAMGRLYHIQCLVCTDCFCLLQVSFGVQCNSFFSALSALNIAAYCSIYYTALGRNAIGWLSTIFSALSAALRITIYYLPCPSC
jgi:hypothetical protein